MSTELNYTCEEKDCKVGTDGKCIQGFEELDRCPHIRNNEAAVNGGPTPLPVDPKAVKSDKIRLSGTDEFTLATACEITLAHLARLIVIAGEADSGKTTLLASLGD